MFSFRRVYTKRKEKRKKKTPVAGLDTNEWSDEQNESMQKKIAVDIIERVFSSMAGRSHGSEHTGYDVENVVGVDI